MLRGSPQPKGEVETLKICCDDEMRDYHNNSSLCSWKKYHHCNIPHRYQLTQMPSIQMHIFHKFAAPICEMPATSPQWGVFACELTRKLNTHELPLRYGPERTRYTRSIPQAVKKLISAINRHNSHAVRTYDHNYRACVRANVLDAFPKLSNAVWVCVCV